MELNAEQIVQKLRAECKDCSERNLCFNGFNQVAYCPNYDAANLIKSQTAEIKSLTERLAESQRRERAAVDAVKHRIEKLEMIKAKSLFEQVNKDGVLAIFDSLLREISDPQEAEKGEAE